VINNNYRDQADNSLKNWREEEKLALELLKVVGRLRFDRSIELVLFREDIYDTRPSTVLSNHALSRQYIDRQLSIEDSLQVAQRILKMKDLKPAKIDIGVLLLNWHEDIAALDLNEFLDSKLASFRSVEAKNGDQRDVVLYGFGRIGRLAARRIIAQTGKGEQLRLKAIVVRPKLKDQKEEALKRAALLQSDSIHGDFHGAVMVSDDGDTLIINGNEVQLIYAQHPSDIDYTQYGITDAIVIDNTGVWRTEEELSQHLRPGISHVLLTAPGKDDVPNIVYGVNQDNHDFTKQKVLSAASCTTNAIVPALEVLHTKIGVAKGHVETIHSYTNDQNLIDNFHKKPRRGRGAPINMVLTSTGAATAVSKVLPELSGKLTGNAIRVPTPNVSMAILNLTFDRVTSLDEVNDVLREASLHGTLVEQIHCSQSTEFVSSNAIGMTSTCVVDMPSTQISADGLSAVVYLWYDNEYGYTCQVVRLAKHVMGVRRFYYC